MKPLSILASFLMTTMALAQDVSGDPLHTERSFAFVANGSLARVGPLFGADKEQVWAPDWRPSFVWPSPARDREGMVFTVLHGDEKATWVNTCFDLQSGRVQYVYVVPESMVTVITLRLQEEGARTHVAVVYHRTALNPSANDIVREMAEHDATSGPDWERQVNAYLEKHAE